MAERLVYFNGEFVSKPEARISIFDYAQYRLAAQKWLQHRPLTDERRDA